MQVNKQKKEEWVDSTHFIFDDVYKNAKEKEQFSTNAKYAYFNALAKIKNKTKQSRREVYNKIFENQTEGEENIHKMSSGYLTKKSMNQFQKPRKVFNVEKINGRMFKIYKKKQNSFFSKSSQMPPLNDIQFKIFSSKGNELSKSKKFFKRNHDVPLMRDSRMKRVNFDVQGFQNEVGPIMGLKFKNK